MFILDMNKLELGDIFLTTQNHKISKAIRIATSSSYSHAILYVGNGSYIHSDGSGVHSGNIQRLLFEKESQILVLRLKQDIDRELIKNACDFARREVGKQYSVIEAIKTKNPLSKKNEYNRQFCSRLVAQSFASVGLNLVENSSYCAPIDIEKSQLTVPLENYLRIASEVEVQFANSENPLEKQTLITNQIFSEVRNLTGEDIQTFEQLLVYLIKNKEFDRKVTNIVKESGYLLLWQYDLKANPWRYDAKLFMEIPVSQEELHQIAQFEIDSATEMKSRYEFMFQQFMTVWQQHKLHYAAINIVLLQKLVELNDTQIKVGKYVLENILKQH